VKITTGDLEESHDEDSVQHATQFKTTNPEHRSFLGRSAPEPNMDARGRTGAFYVPKNMPNIRMMSTRQLTGASNQLLPRVKRTGSLLEPDEELENEMYRSKFFRAWLFIALGSVIMGMVFASAAGYPL
jgi:hypothetical protein